MSGLTIPHVQENIALPLQFINIDRETNTNTCPICQGRVESVVYRVDPLEIRDSESPGVVIILDVIEF